nr:MAG: hypothetical protein [XiangYun nudi-like virus]
MSALLKDIEATPLKLFGEYGRSVRTFSRVSCPRPDTSPPPTSALFMVYTQLNTIESRMHPFRNHFMLYVDDTARVVVIARVDTTVAYDEDDHDACIMYETINLSPDKSRRHRVDFDGGRWVVSFDREIEYSVNSPDLSTCRLVGVGEWWLFDNGVVLSGIKLGDLDDAVPSLLVYYELHTKHRIWEQPGLLEILVARYPEFEDQLPLEQPPKGDSGSGQKRRHSHGNDHHPPVGGLPALPAAAGPPAGLGSSHVAPTPPSPSPSPPPSPTSTVSLQDPPPNPEPLDSDDEPPVDSYVMLRDALPGAETMTRDEYLKSRYDRYRHGVYDSLTAVFPPGVSFGTFKDVLNGWEASLGQLFRLVGAYPSSGVDTTRKRTNTKNSNPNNNNGVPSSTSRNGVNDGASTSSVATNRNGVNNGASTSRVATNRNGVNIGARTSSATNGVNNGTDATNDGTDLNGVNNQIDLVSNQITGVSNQLNGVGNQLNGVNTQNNLAGNLITALPPVRHKWSDPTRAVTFPLERDIIAALNRPPAPAATRPALFTEFRDGLPSFNPAALAADGLAGDTTPKCASVKSAIPSRYWFDQRRQELVLGRIEYFLPIN